MRCVTLHLRLFGSRALQSVAIALVLFSGCAELDIRKNIPWGESKDEKYGEPTKVVVMWADAMLNQPEKKGVRGFGGRLYFYGKNPSKPIKVKGTLVIYAFDETSRTPDNVVPDKKFVFTAEQLEKHYSKNDVGASYSIWLPWGEMGGPKKEVSLIARFTSEKGNLVISEQTMQDLPGMPVAESPLTATTPKLLPSGPAQNQAGATSTTTYPGVQTSYQQPVNEPNTATPTARNTTTFSMSASRMNSMQQGMAGADQSPVRAIQPGVGVPNGSPQVQGTGAPAGQPNGVATAQWGVLPNNPAWPNSPGWNQNQPAGFGAPQNFAAAPGQSNAQSNPAAAGFVGAPIGWNASAPWNAGSNPAGLMGATGMPNNPSAGPNVSGNAAMQNAPQSIAPAGWGNKAVPTMVLPNRQAPVTQVSSPASF